MSTVAQTLSKAARENISRHRQTRTRARTEEQSLSRSIRFARIRSAQRSPFSASSSASPLSAVSSLINGLNRKCPRGIRDLGSDTVIRLPLPWPLFPGHRVNGLLAKSSNPRGRDIARLPHVKAASPSMRIFQPQFGSGTADVRRGALSRKKCILQGNQPSIGEIFDIKSTRAACQ